MCDRHGMSRVTSRVSHTTYTTPHHTFFSGWLSQVQIVKAVEGRRLDGLVL